MANFLKLLGIDIDSLGSEAGRKKIISFLQSQQMENHEDFLSWVNSEVFYAIDDLESWRDTLTNTDEDVISDRLVSVIRARGRDLQIDVTREERQSGHCDIVIKKNNYIWKAEAKRYKGKAYINEGVVQYISRYEPGSYSLNHAGFFTYHQHGKIQENNIEVITKIKEVHKIKDISYHSLRPNCFDIIIDHPTSGNPVKIRFYSINCMHGLHKSNNESQDTDEEKPN